jgi:hypothetical protein
LHGMQKSASSYPWQSGVARCGAAEGRRTPNHTRGGAQAASPAAPGLPGVADRAHPHRTQSNSDGRGGGVCACVYVGGNYKPGPGDGRVRGPSQVGETAGALQGSARAVVIIVIHSSTPRRCIPRRQHYLSWDPHQTRTATGRCTLHAAAPSPFSGGSQPPARYRHPRRRSSRNAC